MKKVLVTIAFAIFCTNTYALSGITKGGHTACATKEWLDDVIDFVVANDKESFQAYLNSKKCFILKKGIRVTITESPGMFGGTTGFVYKGIKLWTVREALEY